VVISGATGSGMDVMKSSAQVILGQIGRHLYGKHQWGCISLPEIFYSILPDGLKK
jgi:hypothetical protein